MKNLIILIAILLSITSCVQSQYTYKEVAAFVANDEATFTEDSITVYNPITDEMEYKRFALLNSAVYYPAYSVDGELFYTIAIR